MHFADTHCHIHEAQFELAGDNATRSAWLRAHKPNPDDMIARAVEKGVTRIICVGTSAADSKLAVDFVQGRPNCWASVGLHPHEAKDGEGAFRALAALLTGDNFQSGAIVDGFIVGSNQLPSATTHPQNSEAPSGASSQGVDWQAELVERAATAPSKIVAIGECGLDYYYNHSPKKDQIKALRFQIELAQRYDLPLIFHVRDALDDFWPIFDSYPHLRGVLHSYTDSRDNLDKALARNLYIGANGIMTFTRDQTQLDMIRAVPLQKLLVETDAPFLTPKPFRGSINEPAHVSLVTEFLATLRGESVNEFAHQTTRNAQTLFQFK